VDRCVLEEKERDLDAAIFNIMGVKLPFSGGCAIFSFSQERKYYFK